MQSYYFFSIAPKNNRKKMADSASSLHRRIAFACFSCNGHGCMLWKEEGLLAVIDAGNLRFVHWNTSVST